MKIRVDKETDSLYFRLDESRIIESEEVQPGVILDYDEHDQVVGIEFLRISSIYFSCRTKLCNCNLLKNLPNIVVFQS